jgi:hypothetical protein
VAHAAQQLVVVGRVLVGAAAQGVDLEAQRSAATSSSTAASSANARATSTPSSVTRNASSSPSRLK